MHEDLKIITNNFYQEKITLWDIVKKKVSRVPSLKQLTMLKILKENSLNISDLSIIDAYISRVEMELRLWDV